MLLCYIGSRVLFCDASICFVMVCQFGDAVGDDDGANVDEVGGGDNDGGGDDDVDDVDD